MAKKYSMFLTVTAFMSIVSVTIICISMATENWISSTVSPASGLIAYGNSEVNYGLFEGTLIRRIVQTPTIYDLYITCIWGSNACAWSCMSTHEERITEVETLLAGGLPSFACTPRGSSSSSSGVTVNSRNGTDIPALVNAGAWVSNVIFMVLFLTAAVISAVLSVINSIWNPPETYFNVLGIFIANIVAGCLNVIPVLISAIHYAIITQEDVAIRDTIVGEFTSKSILSFSFWILLVPVVLHGVNIGLLLIREWLINSEPPETKIDIDEFADGTIVLF
ncbi:uncharacterized protein LOC105688260 [Athalia rosae]|uniref:uncharacterized protein LOC105688260 n=1 Tax=Athalia rosae TaxID=37344 RepID=UPI002033B93A|nr:uncharacterized protein LOC105688260 [Athalia rosae]XP_012259835.2 uncharacterized protein LOC105688260 [Athalia rosae]